MLIMISKSLHLGLSKVKDKVLVAQLCLTLWDPMDCNLPGSSVHGILQARILEWVAIPFFRDQTQVSCIAGRFFTVWATREGTSKIYIINTINPIFLPG